MTILQILQLMNDYNKIQLIENPTKIIADDVSVAELLSDYDIDLGKEVHKIRPAGENKITINFNA